MQLFFTILYIIITTLTWISHDLSLVEYPLLLASHCGGITPMIFIEKYMFCLSLFFCKFKSDCKFWTCTPLKENVQVQNTLKSVYQKSHI